MEQYLINDTTLTDIGDALRSKFGETEMGIVIEEQTLPVVKISRTEFATGFDDTWSEATNATKIVEVINISDANSIIVDIACQNTALFPLYIVAGEYTVDNFPKKDPSAVKYATGASRQRNEHIFENTNSISILWSGMTGYGYGYYAEITGLDADGNIIKELQEVEVEKEIRRTFFPSQMSELINELSIKIPEELLVITGNCNYRFAYNGWNLFIDHFRNEIKTNNITDMTNMFTGCSKLQEIPFEINGNPNVEQYLNYMFNSCNYLTCVPKINHIKPYSLTQMFANCYSIREIPEDFCDTWDWSVIDNATSTYAGNMSNLFSNCYSLRKPPMQLLHGNPKANNNYTLYSGLFNTCYSLDEITNIPLVHTTTYTANMFSYAGKYCRRIKDFTFALQEDGTPYVMNWKSQTIDLSGGVGFHLYSSSTPTNQWSSSQLEQAAKSAGIISYNSGITIDKAIYTEATYQALKDDPDAFCLSTDKEGPMYSRYTHRSAVATINSLPDTSAYLASAGGTNTIKFTGAAGSKTDEGAINTLTAEEIAVAAAKGWTVTLV